MKFEVLKRLRFAGTIRVPGDIVEVDGERASELQGMGWIGPVKETVPVPKPRARKKKVEDEAPTDSSAGD